MRVVGYARLSRATEESTAIARQRKEITDTARARGWELVGIEEDNDVSATRSRLNRPGLTAARDRLTRGEADAVLVWKLDRLARSVVDFGLLLDAGVQMISCTEALDTTTAMGRAMAEILQVFAAMEARTIGARVSSARRHLPTVGRFPGGIVPYGYRAVPHPSGIGRALEPEPAEAAAIRLAATHVLGGRSVYAVCKSLNEAGIKPRRAAQWSASSLQRLLRSDAVLGRVRVGTEYAKGTDGKKRKVRSATVLRDENGMPVQQWEPILSLDEVEQLRALTQRTPTPGRAEATAEGRRRKASRVLSGLISCPGCGGTLVAKSRRSAGKPVYACQASAQGRKCERGVVVECDRVETEVERQFLAVFGRYTVVEQRVRVRETAELARVTEAIRTTSEELQHPGADIRALAERLTKLHAERVRLDEVPSNPVSELVDTGRSFAEEWEARDYLGRRELLIGCGAAIELAYARQRGKWDPARVSLAFDRR